MWKCSATAIVAGVCDANYGAYTVIDANRRMLVGAQGGNEQTSIEQFACNEEEGTGLMLQQ